jgi:hypothetical protein
MDQSQPQSTKRRKSNPNNPPTNNPNPQPELDTEMNYSSTPTNSSAIDLSDIDIAEAFKMDINSFAISHVKMTFAVLNCLDKIKSKTLSLTSLRWPKHILNKVKLLPETMQISCASTLLREEIAALEQKALNLDKDKSTLKESLLKKIHEDLLLHNEDKAMDILETHTSKILSSFNSKVLQQTALFTSNQNLHKAKAEKRKLKKTHNTIAHQNDSDRKKLQNTIKKAITMEVKK